MARRILPAQSALRPPEQNSLAGGRPDSASSLQIWNKNLQLSPKEILFNWEESSELMDEVSYVNQGREKIDQAVIVLAPSMLRIVLTVKANLPNPKDQRDWLAKHVDWDFRRISELCIVAESYQLLNPQNRLTGEAELRRYGWSNALKLAYVRNPEARQQIWESACGDTPRASYRQVLKALHQYRSPLHLEAPVPDQNLHEGIAVLRASWEALQNLQHSPYQAPQTRLALEQVKSLEKKLPSLKRTLMERLKTPSNPSNPPTSPTPPEKPLPQSPDTPQHPDKSNSPNAKSKTRERLDWR